jgi:hypothetical protein
MSVGHVPEDSLTQEWKKGHPATLPTDPYTLGVTRAKGLSEQQSRSLTIPPTLLSRRPRHCTTLVVVLCSRPISKLGH